MVMSNSALEVLFRTRQANEQQRECSFEAKREQ
jgi:hypothetical protein